MCAVHGLTVYRANIDLDFAFLNQMGGCTVRVLLDLRTTRRKRYPYHEAMFQKWIMARMRVYENIEFLNCRTLPEWKELCDVPDDDTTEYHASKAKNRLWCLWPWLYAKKHNRNVVRDAEGITLIDFINI